VLALVSFDGQLLNFDPRDLRVSRSLDGIDAGGSDVSPGLTIGAGSIWITASGAVTRVGLRA
jgi:hypothetical protein